MENCELISKLMILHVVLRLPTSNYSQQLNINSILNLLIS